MNKFLNTIAAIALICAIAGPAVASPSAVSVPPKVTDQYKVLCTEKWTKRGTLDNEMFSYCMGNQTEGYEKLVHLVSKYASKPWTQFVLDYAIQRWTKKGIRNDEMVAYTFGQQVDAYEDIAYEVRQPTFNKGRMTSCYAHWGINFEMLHYCYKKDEEERLGATLKQTLDFETVFPENRS